MTLIGVLQPASNLHTCILEELKLDMQTFQYVLDGRSGRDVEPFASLDSIHLRLPGTHYIYRQV